MIIKTLDNDISLSSKQLVIFYLLSFLFLVVNFVAVLGMESYIVNIVPIAMIILVALFFAMDKLLLFSVLCVPLSIPLREIVPDIAFNIDLPTEPLFVAIMLLFVVKELHFSVVRPALWRHPVARAFYVYLLWQLLTVCTSTMPLVSLKHWLASLWFIIPFFFLLTHIFGNTKNIDRFLWLYIIPFLGVIIYTVVRHGMQWFGQEAAHEAMNPFYNDHTSYGAALAMFLPILLHYVVCTDVRRSVRVAAMFVLPIFVVALILSYTRAAWVSLLGAVGIFLMLRLKINYKVVLTAAVLAVSGFFIFQDVIYVELSYNRQASSTDLREHFTSITNVATDASNLERINRWSCARRMFIERPMVGWGPGTYQFVYAPFQQSSQKTNISTNAGDRGNAHSEYWGTLSESGIFGLLSFASLIIIIVATGFKAYAKATSKRLKSLVAAALAGLSTYIVHALLNNFLDVDKIAVPFWGFAAIIVAIDIIETQPANALSNKININLQNQQS